MLTTIEAAPETIEAVYENGLFRPLQPVELPDGQQVALSVTVPLKQPNPDEMLALMAKIYEGLSEEDIAEVEAIALDRSNFIRPEQDGQP